MSLRRRRRRHHPPPERRSRLPHRKVSRLLRRSSGPTPRIPQAARRCCAAMSVVQPGDAGSSVVASRYVSLTLRFCRPP
ncbi:MAG: hypothetical protein DCC58_13870 [Chloroflexi bacterium]|nr:MAG: hypothetical protein DCC58_13870 [Chloroflexota bacterium]